MPRKYARIDNGMVSEIVNLEDGEPSLASRYHAALLDHFVELHGPEQYTIRLGWNYDGSGFSEPAPPQSNPAKRYVKVSLVRERMEAAGKWENLVAILQTDMAKLIKVLTLEIGVDVEDQEVRQIILMAGADPDIILAA
jgi:hypothetical protein